MKQINRFDMLGQRNIYVLAANRDIVKALDKGEYEGYKSFGDYINKCLEKLSKQKRTAHF